MKKEIDRERKKKLCKKLTDWIRSKIGNTRKVVDGQILQNWKTVFNSFLLYLKPTVLHVPLHSHAHNTQIKEKRKTQREKDTFSLYPTLRSSLVLGWSCLGLVSANHMKERFWSKISERTPHMALSPLNCILIYN